MKRKVVLAYIPVLHRGYVDFLEHHRDAAEVYLFGPELIAEFGHLRKDLRALAPERMRSALAGMLLIWPLLPGRIRVADLQTLAEIAKDRVGVIMPDEEECQLLAEKYLAGCEVEFDRSVFLRWDRKRTLAEEEIFADRTVAGTDFLAKAMGIAYVEAEQATNLWRRVGAVIARNGEVLLVAHNTQVPSPRTPYYEGDPRMFFKQGLQIELTTDDHAERRLIAEAARRGVALEGSDLFVTTFPCPPCGKQVSFSGVRRCFFVEGYAMLDSARILRDQGIELVKVQMKDPGA